MVHDHPSNGHDSGDDNEHHDMGNPDAVDVDGVGSMEDAEAAEDLADLQALREALAEDDGTRFTHEELLAELAAIEEAKDF